MIKLRVTLALFFLSCALGFSQNSGSGAGGRTGGTTGGNPGSNAGGETVLRAIQKSFPAVVTDVLFIENDWAVIAGGETFFWAGGRLLPKAVKDETDSYSPHLFYNVPVRPAPPDSYPPEYIETLRSRGSSQARMERKDSNRAFQGVLYGGLDRDSIEALIERIDFLGFKINIHRDIAPVLRRIDAEIKKQDVLDTFIDSIGSIEGYNWREIAGTQRMSYHSWGLAIDIQPKRLGGKAIYWQWERGRNRDWMLVPLENRWNPPDQVIEIFEKEGFIWGGKWPFYDNMHFEYRPELHELARLIASNSSINAGRGLDLHHIHPNNIK